MRSYNIDSLLNDLIDRLADAVAARLESRLPQSHQPNELTDEPEMAKRLGISQQSLQRRRKAGDIPAIRCGRRVLYRPADVLSAMSQEGGAE